MNKIPHNDETDEIYCLYGRAAHHCFNIEVCCVFLLQWPELRKNHKLSELTPERIDKVWMKIELSTLGELIRKIKKHFNLTRDNEVYLQKVLDKRNYLTHEFFGTYGKRMYLPDTWPVMKNELQELLSFFEEASDVFMKWSGITQENA